MIHHYFASVFAALLRTGRYDVTADYDVILNLLNHFLWIPRS